MKRIKHILLVFTILLAPLAARADIATPPNDYTGFLYHGGHYVGSIVGGSKGGERVVPILAGFCVAACFLLLVWLCMRHREKKIVPMEYVVLGILLGSAVTGGMMVFQDMGDAIVAVKEDSDHSWPKLLYNDTPELRAEYDRKCIQYYETYKASTNCSTAIRYKLVRDAPIIRPGAPEAVTNAYLRFRKELKNVP